MGKAAIKAEAKENAKIAKVSMDQLGDDILELGKTIGTAAARAATWTAVLVIATFIYAGAAVWLALETRALRKLYTPPAVVETAHETSAAPSGAATE